MAAIRIMIADDHPIVRLGLTTLIESQADMKVIAQAGSGKEAVELYRKNRPDIVLMDLRMRQLNGVEAIAEIRKDFPDAKVIVLTSYQGEEEIYRTLQAGARGYLLKDTLHDRLLAAIREVHEGRSCIPQEVASKLARRIPLSDLTPRELQILKAIVQGLSNKQIAAQLHVAEGTVKNHVANVLQKLGVNDRTQAATAALERGIIHTHE